MGDQLIGLGFDVHPRDHSRKLFLGGLRFDGEPGLRGHSDGDAVCHALADALLGAAGLGDIGQHFPETDPRVTGMEGIELLSRTVAKVRVAGCSPVSADVTVIAERPSIEPRRDEMRTTLAAALGISIDRMSVKASRPEGLGLSGDGAGCLALAVLTKG